MSKAIKFTKTGGVALNPVNRAVAVRALKTSPEVGGNRGAAMPGMDG